MSRLLFVIQEDTPRSFPLPPPLPVEVEKRLLNRLQKMTQTRGQFKMPSEPESWYVNWYHDRSRVSGDNKHFAGYSERKPDHLLRMAMILAIADERLEYSVSDFERALKILEWTEAWLPGTFDQLQESGVGQDQVQIIQQLKKRRGAEKHSALLRLNCRKMNAEAFRRCMSTLRDANLVDYDGVTKTYILTTEGWKHG